MPPDAMPDAEHGALTGPEGAERAHAGVKVYDLRSHTSVRTPLTAWPWTLERRKVDTLVAKAPGVLAAPLPLNQEKAPCPCSWQGQGQSRPTVQRRPQSPARNGAGPPRPLPERVGAPPGSLPSTTPEGPCRFLWC